MSKNIHQFGAKYKIDSSDNLNHLTIDSWDKIPSGGLGQNTQGASSPTDVFFFFWLLLSKKCVKDTNSMSPEKVICFF